METKYTLVDSLGLKMTKGALGDKLCLKPAFINSYSR